MRVLVTGGSGFVGGHVVARLREEGHEVVVADLKPFPGGDVETVVGDLRDKSVVEAALQPGTDAVVHLAALTSVLQSVNEPEAVYDTNVAATSMLLERCRELGVGRFVLASTNAVVGDVGFAAIDEQIVLRPLTPYGATKAAGEMLLSAYGACYAMQCVALRFTNIYGAGMQVKDSVVARLMRAAMAGGGIQIYGDGEQVRDYLYVTDAVAAIVLGLSLGHSDTLTIGAGVSVSMNELHRLCCEATGVEIGAEHIEGKAGEMPAVIVSLTHATELGFTPAYTVLEGLKATWADFTAAG
ncbi:MAG TPA: NAD-dependent epimerase/dehydratase family protein [Acidimicrobiales bacterium]|nr:NAD-dependent epimerase/dehydratase family protein [Acidimicrobiales bacterium]